MGKTVEINPTTRHEGHTKLVLKVDDEGIVEKGAYLSVTPVRGFERFLEGKPAEFAPLAVMRFCGICQSAHGISSAEAIEDACGIIPPKDGLLLRELLGIGNKMHSHPLHQFLVSPDFVPEKDKVEFIKRVQAMRKVGQYICDVVGGEAIHPPNIKIGGMAKNITESVRSKIYYKCKKYEKLAKEQIDYLIPIFESRALADGTELPEKLGYHDFGYIATHPTYGDRTKIDQDNVVEYTPFDVYEKEVALQASTTIPTLNGRLAEVGPRARFNKFFDFKEKGAMAIHIARAYELIVLVKRAMEIVDELNVNGKTLSNEPIIGDGEKVGLGVHEAARGHNTHQASIDKNGRITYYNAIVATTWNIPLIGKAIEGSHYKFAEHVVRAYDPCVSCATHMIVKDYDNKTVDEKLIH
ncbi:coenzyme F420 hydrogenase subunit alpha [Methanothermococcus okinawensis]|uniref:Coenzyme F420 hydrogenase subunit alpha n=1 Tax=Methanothermococcus okinawensis (strain DSM 14208 / JCM 11175 / IH1) TaxID=647113 RepID=F8ANB4_METOI|nr:coenzyme F420 hydrogenase subunit alpha [Methanothermococcus okinawensis]AEH06173.1 coenzyme F420 hydrogenase, subunit alpha [Methanothermococcus okinawensis IH1]